jgi:hypothetical protein
MTDCTCKSFRNDESGNWRRETSVTVGIWERFLDKNYGSNIVLKSLDRVMRRAAVSIFFSETM